MKLFTVLSTNTTYDLSCSFNWLATCSATVALGLASIALPFSQQVFAQQIANKQVEVVQPVEASGSIDITRLLVTRACRGCDLIGANLRGKHLIGVDLRDANLTNAILSDANLEGADLTGATLINTDLSGAFLTNTFLDEATISEVDFSGATLIYTSLEGASVGNVDLLNAKIVNTPISIGGSYDQ